MLNEALNEAVQNLLGNCPNVFDANRFVVVNFMLLKDAILTGKGSLTEHAQTGAAMKQ